MAKYYVFYTKRSFTKWETKRDALHLSKLRNGLVFRHIDGIPNPWFCHRVLENGKYELDKNGNKKVYKPNELDRFKELYFKYGKLEDSKIKEIL